MKLKLTRKGIEVSGIVVFLAGALPSGFAETPALLAA
jgi:hypothetical protein